MTTLLLDTHTYVWAVTAPDLLSDSAREAIADPANTLLLSAASTWEMAIKHHAGRWPEAEILLRQHDDLARRLGAVQHPITAADAIRAGALTWAHRDPFDRMLAAQTFLSQATLVTRDDAFGELSGLPTLW
ncbi:MAG TPA: type II toxin-antitoxin system VapC family toxin [Euzebya sp.]|nr:type II toxin-antitoxin system VapC family toxin [Euzebya sp.]